MFKTKPSAPAVKFLLTAAACALAATVIPAHAQTASTGPVIALAPAQSVKKVTNGKFAAEVDNGWVIYQGFQGQPTLNFYDTDITGSLKLVTAGFGAGGAGLFFDAGGIVFGPCTAAGKNRCEPNSDTGTTGVGIGFGQASFGGPGGGAGGWVNDSSLNAHLTNTIQAPGSIAGLAIDPVNGAYAVGWDANNPTSNSHAIIWTLNSAAQTYVPLSEVDLGTLGGTVSGAWAISKNAQYVVGIANDAANKAHAVFALTTATSWTDISTGFPAVMPGIIKSRAFAVSDTGYVAGSADVKRLIRGKTQTVSIGFVYNTANSSVKFFEAPGYNVQPLKALADGRVVGNLVLAAPGTIKSYHPFIFDGTNLVDFGTMTLASTGLPAFGCRVSRPNNLGELAGSCIPNNTTPYGAGGAAFYINAAGGSPAFIDVNAAMHANANGNTPGLSTWSLGEATSIDDQDEITIMGEKFVGGNLNLVAYLATKPAYNP